MYIGFLWKFHNLVIDYIFSCSISVYISVLLLIDMPLTFM